MINTQKLVSDIALDFSKGLVPVVIQDVKTNKVLMLGYMNQEAFDKTKEERKVTFFSRSKNRLWTKGEESKNYLNVEEILIDCDQDTVLIKVTPEGPTCHTGKDTCWGEVNEKKKKSFPFLKKLESVIENRKSDKPDNSNSYIKKLLNKGSHKIAQKVGEEAVELVIESGRMDDELFLEESSDLLFHYLILLHDRGYEIKDVLRILQGRNKTK